MSGPIRLAGAEYASANATNAKATATIAAKDDNSTWYISHVSASFSGAPGSPVLMELKNGSTTLMSWYVSDPLVLNFQNPLKVPAADEALSVELNAGGAGVVGRVNLGAYAT